MGKVELKDVPETMLDHLQRRREDVLAALIEHHRNDEARVALFRAQLATTRTWRELRALMMGEIGPSEYEAVLGKALDDVLRSVTAREQERSGKAMTAFLVEYRRTVALQLATNGTYDLLKYGAVLSVVGMVAFAWRHVPGEEPSPSATESAATPAPQEYFGPDSPGDVRMLPYDDFRSGAFDPQRWRTSADPLESIYKSQGSLHLTADGRGKRDWHLRQTLEGIVPEGTVLRAIRFDFRPLQADAGEVRTLYWGIIFSPLLQDIDSEGKDSEYIVSQLVFYPQPGVFEVKVDGNDEEILTDVCRLGSRLRIGIERVGGELRFYSDGVLRVVRDSKGLELTGWRFTVSSTPGRSFHAVVDDLRVGYA